MKLQHYDAMNNFKKLIAVFCFAALSFLQATILLADDNDSQCIHWQSSFVFTEFMDRARVTIDKGERLYFYKPHPDLCEIPNDCKHKSYLIPGDEVTIGNVCRQWAFIEFHSKRGKSTEGWVELSKLSILQPDAGTLETRKKQKPEIFSDEPIVLAAFKGDITQVKALIQANKPSLTRALFAASHANHEDVVDLLLKNGANPNDDKDSCLLFATAIVDSKKTIQKKLIAAGANVNCIMGHGQKRTPLMWVAFQNRAMTPVYVAIGRAHNLSPDYPEAVKFLLAEGAVVDAKDVWGGTALRVAIEKNNVDIARILLDHGADVNNYIDNSTSIGVQEGNVALMVALDWFKLTLDPTMIKLILDYGADVNYRNELKYDEECDKTTSGRCTFQGQTVLTHAAGGEYLGVVNLDIVKLLLSNNADPNIPRTDGKTPAEIARENGNLKIAEIIEEYIKYYPTTGFIRTPQTARVR